MRQNYETSKLYYGFPVILLGYKDANFKYNFTTRRYDGYRFSFKKQCS